jgi:hypothetical protein
MYESRRSLLIAFVTAAGVLAASPLLLSPQTIRPVPSPNAPNPNSPHRIGDPEPTTGTDPKRLTSKTKPRSGSKFRNDRISSTN